MSYLDAGRKCSRRCRNSLEILMKQDQAKKVQVEKETADFVSVYDIFHFFFSLATVSVMGQRRMTVKILDII